MYHLNDAPLTRAQLEELLGRIDGARIGLIGDLCLDMYWIADMKLSELSRETPHYPLPVVEERYAPGGAGNAISNIAALKPGHLSAIGVVGDDWRGSLLLQALRERSIDCTHVVREPGFVTNTYIKPLRCGISDVVYEDPRLDFENRAPITAECEQRILAALNAAANDLDVICVSDQMKFGCITPAVRERLCQLGKAGKTIIVDSRDRIGLYENATLKPNEVELSRTFADGSSLDLDALSALALPVAERMARPMLVTLGDKGCFVIENGAAVRCPACPVEPPIDFCGAGDTFLSGYGTLIASGATPVQAAQVATLCSAVTIKKIGTTGTATRDEVLAAFDQYFGGAV